MTAEIYDEEDNPITVTGEYYPGMKGQRGDFGEALEPDSPAEIELLEAFDEQGDQVELDAEQEKDAIEALWDAVRES